MNNQIQNIIEQVKQAHSLKIEEVKKAADTAKKWLDEFERYCLESKDLRGLKIYDWNKINYSERFGQLLEPIDFEKCRFSLAVEGEKEICYEFVKRIIVRTYFNTDACIWFRFSNLDCSESCAEEVCRIEFRDKESRLRDFTTPLTTEIVTPKPSDVFLLLLQKIFHIS